MRKKETTILWIIIAIALLILASKYRTTTFILYYGQEVEGFMSNTTGSCWTIGTDNCIRYEIGLINLTKQNLLVCPESYYATKSECEKAFKIGRFIPKPEVKVKCYYINNTAECQLEELDECPSIYFPTLEKCEEAIKEKSILSLFKTHISGLLSTSYLFYFIIGGLVAVIILLLKRRK